jgi:hypothetical protein
MAGYRRYRDPCCPNLQGVTSCLFVVAGYQRFRGPCWFHLLGCDAVLFCGRIPTFQRSMLLPSSGLWRRVVLWYTNVLEFHAAALTFVSFHNTTRRHNPEELDVNSLVVSSLPDAVLQILLTLTRARVCVCLHRLLCMNFWIRTTILQYCLKVVHRLSYLCFLINIRILGKDLSVFNC